MIYPIALLLVIGANATWAVRRWVLPWRRRRHELVEQCEVCAKWLTRRQVCELREDATDDVDLDIGIGGTWMSAFYCRKHFPK